MGCHEIWYRHYISPQDKLQQLEMAIIPDLLHLILAAKGIVDPDSVHCSQYQSKGKMLPLFLLYIQFIQTTSWLFDHSKRGSNLGKQYYMDFT